MTTKLSEEKGYNGWTNYETWAVKLWIDNEEGSYRYWQDETRNVIEQCENKYPNEFADLEQNRGIMLAHQLRALHEENAPTVRGVYADLLNASLSEVDWYEIAQSMIEDELEAQKERKEQSEEAAK